MDRVCVRLTPTDFANLAALIRASGRPADQRGSITDAIRHALAFAAWAATADQREGPKAA